MPFTAEHLDRIGFYLDKAVRLEHLSRSDWKRQTDAVQLSFVSAAFFADPQNAVGTAPRFTLVDGRITTALMRDAWKSGDPKGFFNRRCHDEGLTGRRVIIYDTVSTNRMGRKASGRDNLHFHAMFEIPTGSSEGDLHKKLLAVFGRAERPGPSGKMIKMGKRQFEFKQPDWTQHYTHNGVQVSGPLGKVLYAIKGAGAAYSALELNEDGKRSRRAPPTRGGCNKKAAGLAKGIPSNFNRKVVFWDHVSGRAGKEAFEAWLHMKRTTKPNIAGPACTQEQNAA